MPNSPYIQRSDGSVREGRTIDPAGLRLVTVDEPDLSYIRIDHQVRLQFGSTEVVIESSFTLVVDGVEHALDPEEREHLGPLLAAYPDVLRQMAIGDDGTLRMDLESGASLTVPPDPSYEAWQVNGPGSRLIVCSPGGSALSVWT